MTRRVLILGGGTGGTLVANRLRRMFPPDQLDIVVVDLDDRHIYQPGLLFVPFGRARPSDLVRSRTRQLLPGVDFRRAEIDQVDLERDLVALGDGSTVGYDALVVATGAALMPEETEGLTGPGWGTKAHTFYSLEGAASLEVALSRFERGRLVVNVVDMPIKCPVAPLEFSFLADWFLTRKGIRHLVDITFVTSLDGAFTKEVCNRELSSLLEAKRIDVVTEFNTGQVDSAGGRLVSYDGREVGFDLAVVVPLHGGASYVSRSPGLGDGLGFVPTDEVTLQSKASPNVFVVGDATDLTASKAGSVAHFEGEILVHNLARFLDGKPLDASFDGHTNCFIESGFGKALLIDFNYQVDPVPGRFPARWGLPLLKESRLNHLGKLAFESIYWNALLPGRDIPAVPTAMPLAGKHLAAVTG
ncbi:MAG: NAD(P)/FAD-dependent oxidoreductase [Acidobacteriota bacterium]|nr:NAD(P)/FAD-dependent oxidoreductase [Acidobacteriota bacterium]